MEPKPLKLYSCMKTGAHVKNIGLGYAPDGPCLIVWLGEYCAFLGPHQASNSIPTPWHLLARFIFRCARIYFYFRLLEILL